MIIENSTIALSARHQKIELYQQEEHLRSWVGEQQETEEKQLPAMVKDLLEISAEGLQKLKDSTVNQAGGIGELEEFDLDDPSKQKLLILQAMIEQLTGKKFRFNLPLGLKLKDGQPQGSGHTAANSPPARQGWGLEYSLRESFYQKETMSFAADGVVKTADGREINFSVQLNMTKEFAFRQEINFRAGDAVQVVDPLVIHFDTTTPSLTETKYEFDLDMDGKLDTISFAGAGSGFLALDLNGDGIINDGSELFGPQTGQGFRELAAYDEDGNGWIDANDSIYEQLVIWTKDAQGNDRLFSLGEKGIGAIYLGHVNSPFALTDAHNNAQGQIAQTGIFLKENGEAGLIQHIDLVV